MTTKRVGKSILGGLPNLGGRGGGHNNLAAVILLYWFSFTVAYLLLLVPPTKGQQKRLWQAHTKQTFVGPNCSHVAYNLKTLLCCGLFVRNGDPQSYICLRAAVIGQTDKTTVLPIQKALAYCNNSFEKP